jgi:hypothetical protein
MTKITFQLEQDVMGANRENAEQNSQTMSGTKTKNFVMDGGESLHDKTPAIFSTERFYRQLRSVARTSDERNEIRFLTRY